MIDGFNEEPILIVFVISFEILGVVSGKWLWAGFLELRLVSLATQGFLGTALFRRHSPETSGHPSRIECQIDN